jgi:23S rRNA (pseudouridine1915-N3)-methyltransferase
MLKIKVIAMGKCKEEWLRLALREYEKRLSPILEISWVQPKDDAQLIDLLSQEESYIALDSKGEVMDSVEFSQKLVKAIQKNRSRTVFAIGGHAGFSFDILQKADMRWSLSRLTFTHQMIRLILVEQIYRAMEIAKKSPYHK